MPVALKPNLFIIGSMKSGTSYLDTLLSSHPSIFMSRFKEPSYFVDASQLQKLRENFRNGLHLVLEDVNAAGFELPDGLHSPHKVE